MSEMNRREEASSLQQLRGLLWIIVRTTFYSLLLSISLLFRQAIAAFLRTRQGTGPVSAAFLRSEGGKRGAISFFKGAVWHERKSPSLHKFSYSVRYALVNLDCAPSSFTATAAHHHMTASNARSIAGTTGPVYLLTVPTSVGYEQNPLSVYYCFNDDETCLLVCIAEVTNTPWGERVTFLFDPTGDAVAKPLHVSPFMDMSGVWQMKACVPDQNITIRIKVDHPEHGIYFTASLFATRVDCFGTSSERFFWLMPHKTALGIYWQALLLWWKGVGFCKHPKYIDGNAYRGHAISKDKEISLKGQDIPSEDSSSCSYLLKTSALKCARSYSWTEAHWPWT
ncbi:hypothetical protein GOP47_0015287 [Adiantum capillus-veneris]|uniref:DUF1365 domain-containing protein n=1 Tax=Adiantum capillus-veneris TaxID=13818 RepID=A0A9D4UKC5_ADICA|nr:hypothetical protein GOP47_0015287 [Adiantum capillus-veneris]